MTMLQLRPGRFPTLCGPKATLRLALVALSALCFGATTAGAQTSNTVVWNVFDFPPFYITQGPQKNNGLYDEFLRNVAKELPKFDHQIEETSPNRTEELFKRGASVCTVSRLQTADREAYSVFAKQPHLYIVPVQLVVTEQVSKSVAQLRNAAGRVSLAKVLDRRGVRIGVEDNRRYGGTIDALVEASSQEPKSPIFKWKTASLSEDAFKLMAFKRFDATLAYPSEFAQMRLLYPQVKFRSFALEEAPNLIPTKISCANSEVGRAVIQAIDALPMRRPSTIQIQSTYEKLLPSETRESYRNLVAQVGKAQ